MVKIVSFNFIKTSENVVPSGNRPTTTTTHSTLISPEMLKKINSFNFSGIYGITSQATHNFLFIGGAVNIAKRLHQHITGLSLDNDATNLQLRSHYKEFGMNDFDFKVLEQVEIDDTTDRIELFKRERYYIELYEPEYNVVAYRKKYVSQRKYTLDYEPTDIFINTKLLNEFGKPMIYSFSLDHKTGRSKRKIGEIDERRKNMKPVYVTFENDEPLRSKGDVKKKDNTNIEGTMVVRRNPFGKSS